MHKTDKYKKNMPFFDALKTTAAIGLLMQQTAALHCPEGQHPSALNYSYQLISEGKARTISPEMDESIAFIHELKGMLESGYSMLSKSAVNERDFIISKLDPVQTDLIELQLRGLEGGLKNVFKNCVGLDKELLAPYVITIAKARSASSKLNHLIHQMTRPVDDFKSGIDMAGLNALSKHGTEVFFSGRFH